MAENQEKTEAEILEETMQNLGLEEDNEKSSKTENADSQDDAKSEFTEKNSIDENEELIQEVSNDAEDEITAVDDINLNNTEDNNSVEKEEVNLQIDDNDEEVGVQKKQNKMHKILIIILGVLFSIVLIGAILYFSGFFDPELIKEEPKVQKVAEPKKDEYKFNEKDIDSKRLNKKLNLLTKYEIVENSNMEAQKAAEKEKLYLEAKRQLEAERQAQIEKIKEAERKRLNEQLPPVDSKNVIDTKIDKEIEKVIETDDKKSNIQEVKTEDNTTTNNTNDTQNNEVATNNKEEVVITNNETENKDSKPVEEVKQDKPTTNENKVEEIKVSTNDEPIKPVVEDTTTNNVVEDTPKPDSNIEDKKDVKTFVKVIKIDTNKKDIYKSFLDKVLKVDSRVALCRDDKNLVEVFVGPFDDEMERLSIIKEYKDMKIEAEAYDYTQEEYDRRCNY